MNPFEPALKKFILHGQLTNLRSKRLNFFLRFLFVIGRTSKHLWCTA